MTIARYSRPIGSPPGARVRPEEVATRSYFRWEHDDGPDGPLERDDLEELTDEDPHPPCVDKYTLRMRVPGGSADTVKYLAVDSRGRRFLLKVLWNGDPTVKLLLQQEVRLARRIRSNHVGRVLGFHDQGAYCYVVQRFVSGRTLRQVLDDAPDHRLTGPDLLDTALGTLLALRDTHRGGVLHGDESPTNNIITRRGPVLVDLGGGRAADEQRQKMYGTAYYLSIEHLRAERDILAASDIQSWALMIAEAGTGRRPYDPSGVLTPEQYGRVMLDGRTQPALVGLPDGLAELIRQCLEHDPDKRPPMDWLVAQLERLAAAAAPTGTRQLSLLYPELGDRTTRMLPTPRELRSYGYWQQVLQGWRHDLVLQLGTRWQVLAIGVVAAWVLGVLSAVVLHALWILLGGLL